jgi:hypothetical protein
VLIASLCWEEIFLGWVDEAAGEVDVSLYWLRFREEISIDF